MGYCQTLVGFFEAVEPEGAQAVAAVDVKFVQFMISCGYLQQDFIDLVCLVPGLLGVVYLADGLEGVRFLGVLGKAPVGFFEHLGVVFSLELFFLLPSFY